MFSLYLDEDSSSHSLLVALRSAGFDCLTVREAGRETGEDEEQLENAVAQHRVLYSCNVGASRDSTGNGWRPASLTPAPSWLSEQRTPVGRQLRALRHLSDLFDADDMVDRLAYLLNYSP